MLTTEEFLRTKEDKLRRGLSTLELKKFLIEFADMHVREALLSVNDNVRLIQSSSEEINENKITPFITANDNTLWIIDKESIINSYPKKNIL